MSESTSTILKGIENNLYELDMRDSAVVRHETKQRDAKEKGRESTVSPYNGLVSKMLTDAEGVLKGRLRAPSQRSALGVAALRQSKVPLQIVCAIAARTVIDGISNGPRLQTTIRRIGSRIEDQVRMAEFKKREPLLFKWMKERAKERGSEDYAHNRAALVAAIGRADSPEIWVAWDTKAKVSVGTLVMDALLQSGFIERENRPTAKKNRIHCHVRLSAEAEAELASVDAASLDLLKPWYKPMLVPPCDWTTPDNGGYYTIPMTLMKTRKSADHKRLSATAMPTVYEAVNAIQRTAWSINEDVLVAAELLRAVSSTIAGLPILADNTKPMRPSLPPMGTELTDEEKGTLQSYKVARRTWFNGEAVRRSKTTQCLQIMSVARELRAEPAIYFPQQVDYRGRAYAVPSQLNPQSNDLAKGLLIFSDGRPLGYMGAYWLAVHGANTFGIDKGPLADRVDWVMEHEAEILGSASDPLGCQWWSEADGGTKPWQFLAFCLEWAAYVAGGESPEFVSHLPVGMDGSANGIQHFSAMLRDPKGAHATNMTSAPQQDIYGVVAAAVTARISGPQATAVDTEMAGIWKEYGITRSLVKRPVMTTPYGATSIGMKEMILQDTIRLEPTLRWGPKPWETADWIAKVIYEAIGETVQASQSAKEYLQNIAQVAGKEEQAVTWTTPAGLPVVQDIAMTTSFEVNTHLMGRIRLRFAETTPRLDKRKQRSSITPNFVHSYDAAHLMLTVVACELEAGGPMSWAMVHDSFGTHAGDVQMMSRILREEFIAMYRDSSPLSELGERMALGLVNGDKIGPAPEMGSFDLEEVASAEFFFA